MVMCSVFTVRSVSSVVLIVAFLAFAMYKTFRYDEKKVREEINDGIRKRHIERIKDIVASVPDRKADVFEQLKMLDDRLVRMSARIRQLYKRYETLKERGATEEQKRAFKVRFHTPERLYMISRDKELKKKIEARIAFCRAMEINDAIQKAQEAKEWAELKELFYGKARQGLRFAFVTSPISMIRSARSAFAKIELATRPITKEV